MISRCSGLSRQPLATNSAASQSSSSGCVGRRPGGRSCSASGRCPGRSGAARAGWPSRGPSAGWRARRSSRPGRVRRPVVFAPRRRRRDRRRRRVRGPAGSRARPCRRDTWGLPRRSTNVSGGDRPGFRDAQGRPRPVGAFDFQCRGVAGVRSGNFSSRIAGRGALSPRLRNAARQVELSMACTAWPFLPALSRDRKSFSIDAIFARRSVRASALQVPATAPRRLVLSSEPSAIGGLVGRAAVPEVVDVPEEREQPVIILLGDRVDLVVVAAGAVDRQAEERPGRWWRRCRRGRRNTPARGRSARRPRCRGGSNRWRSDASASPSGKLVAGELLADEAVVRLVVVERADDVVAVAPGARLGVVALVAVGLGEADEVEPVPAPLLAVARRGEQAVDEPFVGVGRRVGQERLDLGGRRRQAGQVVGQRGGSARPSTAGGFGRQAPGFQSCEDEARRSGCGPIRRSSRWERRVA